MGNLDSLNMVDVPKKSIAEEREQIARLKNMRMQLEWVKRQLEYATFATKYRLKLAMKRGEVYEFDWGVNVNAEFSHRHYGVVLKDSEENNPLVIVCPLKSDKFGAHPKSDVELGFIPEIRTNFQTLAVVNQIRSLDKMRLYSTMVMNEHEGRSSTLKLKDEQMESISHAIKRLYVDNIALDNESKIDAGQKN